MRLPPLIENHSSLQLLFALCLITTLSSTSALPYPTPSPSIQHQHRRASPPTQYDLLGPSTIFNEAWVDYFSLDGTFLSEEIAVSGACTTIPNTWGILLVTPKSYLDSTVVLYNDASCSTVNREPRGQTGLVVIADYFKHRPQSLRWTTSLPVTSSPPTTSAAPTQSKTTSLGVPISRISVGLPPPPLQPSASSSADSPITGVPHLTGNGPVPTPLHTTFPTALIPPKPLDPSSSSGNDPCAHEGDACQKARHVTQFLIVGIVVAVLAVGLMVSGSYYIYRKFYTPEEPPMSSSSYASKSKAPPLPALAVVSKRRRSLDEDFDDDDDDDKGQKETFHPNEHGLRFDHRCDNIGEGMPSTSSYQYDHSDISLVE
ncbi:hypothetical protein BG006_001882 [Podila minutissima]|uniref:Uncharacterized protein n=1 Tax=Podila minutissima TaxID=64525 RepID=A0A9P5VR84_9FUNG|nr:hypothetical protein BG006_001882 [Podila minutissima]